MTDTPAGMAPAAVAAIADLAKELAKMQNQNLRDVVQYLTKLAEQASQQQTWIGRVRDPIPRGVPIRFWLGNVDDEATLRFEGIAKTLWGGHPHWEMHQAFNTPGPTVIILEVVNSRSGDWKAELHVTAGPQHIVLADVRGYDMPPFTVKRNYIWYCHVA